VADFIFNHSTCFQSNQVREINTSKPSRCSRGSLNYHNTPIFSNVSYVDDVAQFLFILICFFFWNLSFFCVLWIGITGRRLSMASPSSSPTTRIWFRTVILIALMVVLFYVGRPLYWKISATIHDIRHNKQSVREGKTHTHTHSISRWIS
jgi:hypothetical protein